MADRNFRSSRWFLLLGVGALVIVGLVVAGFSSTRGAENTSAEQVVSQPISNLEETAPEKGALAPDFALKNLDGEVVRLSDFRGQPVLINLWATWCGPCREEMPTLDRLQARLGSPDFEVVALSIDREGVDVVRDFYAELDLQALRIYVDTSTMAPINLNVLGVPTTLLLDGNGREIGRYAGPAEWDSEAIVSAIRVSLSYR
ncbi:MAG: TlpA family protein disulfide reductase [Gammaproteobacteria bacterium]|nr:TlpA family protein disulfide reductase [Gammaproteobacteria bacterium]